MYQTECRLLFIESKIDRIVKICKKTQIIHYLKPVQSAKIIVVISFIVD
ncbi:hypothetical protein HMPREF0476_0656 [Kingella kingae ATCC 23330]|uniref:Uncharacterized protein n=1 Tax=Kingella kingae ATCC 23330 TaxID=887327 RepID=F5S623_KINKI|nr:hypothetical protein HMPREF0476_0656 [Kingella kingae ATCC 23330]